MTNPVDRTIVRALRRGTGLVQPAIAAVALRHPKTHIRGLAGSHRGTPRDLLLEALRTEADPSVLGMIAGNEALTWDEVSEHAGHANVDVAARAAARSDAPIDVTMDVIMRFKDIPESDDGDQLPQLLNAFVTRCRAQDALVLAAQLPGYRLECDSVAVHAAVPEVARQLLERIDELDGHTMAFAKAISIAAVTDDVRALYEACVRRASAVVRIREAWDGHGEDHPGVAERIMRLSPDHERVLFVMARSEGEAGVVAYNRMMDREAFLSRIGQGPDSRTAVARLADSDLAAREHPLFVARALLATYGASSPSTAITEIHRVFAKLDPRLATTAQAFREAVTLHPMLATTLLALPGCPVDVALDHTDAVAATSKYHDPAELLEALHEINPDLHAVGVIGDGTTATLRAVAEAATLI